MRRHWMNAIGRDDACATRRCRWCSATWRRSGARSASRTCSVVRWPVTHRHTAHAWHATSERQSVLARWAISGRIPLPQIVLRCAMGCMPQCRSMNALAGPNSAKRFVAHNIVQRAADSNMQQTTCSRHHAADNMQQTTCNRHHAADSNMQQTTCNRQHAADNTQLTTCGADSWRAGTLRGSFSHWRQWAKAERARASESALAHAEDELRAKVRGQSNHGTTCCSSACALYCPKR